MASSCPSAVVLSSTQDSLLSLLANAPDLQPFQVHCNAIVELHEVAVGMASRPAAPKPARCTADSPPPSTSLLQQLGAACSTGLQHLRELLHFIPSTSPELSQHLATAYMAGTPLPAAVSADMSSAELALVADVSRPLQCLCNCLAAEVERVSSESGANNQCLKLLTSSGE